MTHVCCPRCRLRFTPAAAAYIVACPECVGEGQDGAPCHWWYPADDLAHMACHVRDVSASLGAPAGAVLEGLRSRRVGGLRHRDAQSARRRRRGRVHRARSDSDESRSRTPRPLMAPLAMCALTVNSGSSSLKLNVLDENPTPRRSGPVSSCMKIDQEQVAAAYALPAFRRERLAPDRLTQLSS